MPYSKPEPFPNKQVERYYYAIRFHKRYYAIWTYCKPKPFPNIQVEHFYHIIGFLLLGSRSNECGYAKCRRIFVNRLECGTRKC